MAEVRDGLLEEARAAYTRSDYARALGEVEQAWPLIEGLAGDERDECLTDAYELRAFVYRSQGAFERAVEALQSMLAHARTPERALDARALLGGMLVVRGQYDEAVALLSEVEQQALSLGYRPAAATAAYELGAIAYKRGETDQALKYLGRAWTLYRALNNATRQQRTLVLLGHARARRGEYDSAIRYHEESLRLAQAAGDKMGAAVQLNNLGECHQRLGDMPAALDYHQRSMAMRGQHDLPVSADLIRNLGVDLLGLDRHIEALDHLHRALEMALRDGNKDYVMQTQASLAEALFACDQQHEAQSTAQALLDDATRLQAPYFRARALMLLGRVQLARSDRAGAYALFEEGVCAAQGVHSTELLWKIHSWLGEACTAPALADVHDRIAGELLLESAARVKDADLKQRFLASPHARRVLDRARAKGIKLTTRRLGRL